MRRRPARSVSWDACCPCFRRPLPSWASFPCVQWVAIMVAMPSLQSMESVLLLDLVHRQAPWAAWGLCRLFRPTSNYLLRFGAPGRHTQAWASPPPQPVASLPHHRKAFLERSSSVSRAFLRAFLAVLGPVSSDFSAAALHSALPSPPFVVPMVLVR
jgi:hypothetical protein